MATRAQVVLTFSTVLGINPLTVELILRYLSKAGLVPQGLPGRRSAHYTAEHLKNLILALAAYLPSEAVKTVEILNGLICQTNALMNSESLPGVKKGVLFGDWLNQEIVARVVRVEADHVELNSGKPPFWRPQEVQISVNPPRAINQQPRIGNHIQTREDMYHYDSFYEKNWLDNLTSVPVLSRQTSFTVELLIAAGALLADTLATQATTPIPDPVPGRTDEGNATPEKTKAAGSGNHDGLPDTPAPRKRRQRPLNKAQPIASQGGKQLSCATADDHSGDRVRGAGHSTCNL